MNGDPWAALEFLARYSKRPEYRRVWRELKAEVPAD
jgi:hypothetical protein